MSIMCGMIILFSLLNPHPNLNGMFYDMADFNAIGYFVHFSQAEDGTIPTTREAGAA